MLTDRNPLGDNTNVAQDRKLKAIDLVFRTIDNNLARHLQTVNRFVAGTIDNVGQLVNFTSDALGAH